ncbi:response regulator transcription factor [Opitutaceae bacterium LMO-CP1]|uniref:Response regulator transcription factor n=2 Tax=Synoicihabitans lomoniglobus TaxID=2909285 RepID=A0AAE9ZVQ5_9BACT|nr:response regulator transcription factor [Opitutaceae bacterium LMO-M01]WED63730.1 response regulator transcription factor [Opitutaceae bacterium LMO-M01]
MSSSAALESTATRVLMIDDDQKFCRLVTDYLKPLGYAVTAVHEGPSGVERCQADSWDVVLLDVMLPGWDGFDVLRRIRQHSTVPVLMLTARGDEMDRIVGLEVGADDYLPKTFSTRELLARLRAVLRRSAREESAAAATAAPMVELVAGPLRMLPEARAAFLNDDPMDLTPVEFDLLLSLVRAKGRVRSREALLDEVRERNYDVFDRSIDVHVSALRKKLGDDARSPRFIRTMRSAGYLFIDPDAS